MTTEKQPEALRMADCYGMGNHREVAAELRRQHASIVELESELAHMTDLWVLAHNERSAATTKVSELESQLESIGAGGVTRLVAGVPAEAEPVGEVRAKSDAYGGTFVIWKQLPVAGMLLYTHAQPAIALEPLDVEAWAELHTLREAVKGPGCFDTWQDAAVHERLRLNEVEKTLAELEAARYDYASEFPLTEDGEPDKGSIHQNIRALKLDNSLLRADAARYEFIRANGVHHLQFERGECGTGVYLGAAADQAIDAAIKEAKP